MALYISLQLSGRLNGYLTGIDQQAMDMFSQLVEQMAKQEGIAEQLKAENQMERVRQMNNTKNFTASPVPAVLPDELLK